MGINLQQVEDKARDAALEVLREEGLETAWTFVDDIGHELSQQVKFSRSTKRLAIYRRALNAHKDVWTQARV